MLAEIISLRGQLQESTSRTLGSQKNFDYQWLQGVVQQASHDARSSHQRDLTEIMRRIEAQSRNSQDLQKELTPFINKVTSRTMKTMISGGMVEGVDPIPPTMPSTICLGSTLRE